MLDVARLLDSELLKDETILLELVVMKLFELEPPKLEDTILKLDVATQLDL